MLIRNAIPVTDIAASSNTQYSTTLYNSLSWTGASNPIIYWACGGTMFGAQNSAKLNEYVNFPSVIGIAPRYSTGNNVNFTEIKMSILAKFNESAQLFLHSQDCDQSGCRTVDPNTRDFGNSGNQYSVYCPGSTVKSWLSYSNMFKDFSSESEMEDYIQKPSYAHSSGLTPLGIGIVFDSTINGSWSYSLRVNQSLIPPTDTMSDPFYSAFEQYNWNTYIRVGVTVVQGILDNYILLKQNSLWNSTKPAAQYISLDYVPFPISPSKVDQFSNNFASVIGLFFVLSWIWSFSRLVRNLVEEKENKIKEGMKTMGLHNSIFWLSWAFTYIFIMSCTTVVVAYLLNGMVLTYTSFLLILILFALFSISTISLGLWISTIFSRAKTAGIFSMVGLVVLFLPFFGVNGNGISFVIKMASCLSSPLAFAMGLSIMNKYQGAFLVLDFSTMTSMSSNFSLFWAFVMLGFDSVLYFFLAWYCDQVIPQEFGIPKPWYFLFTFDYWRNLFCSKNTISTFTLEDFEDSMDSQFEPVGPNMKSSEVIRIANVRREFGGLGEEVHVAVNNVSLSIYEGQIFALLGHNGAGMFSYSLFDNFFRKIYFNQYDDWKFTTNVWRFNCVWSKY